MSCVVLLLLLFVFPFGPALQNLGMLIAVICMVVYLVRGRIRPALPPPGPLRWAWLSMLAFLSWNVISSALNTDNVVAEKTAYFIGYAPILVLPWLAGSLPALSADQKKRLENVAAIIVLIWGLLALSQTLWPWRWVGAMPMPGGIPRAQGFYSHPLTLAYAALLIWPFAVIRVLQKPRIMQSWMLALGTLLMLIYSMSRTAQALAGFFLLLNVFLRFSGQRRWQILGLCALLGLGLGLTRNPVSIRFQHLIHGTEANTHFSDYPDDRLAFWHAHLLMIQERPILGHGVHLGLAFRHPYYVRLGLGDFPKQYQAHNQYLQMATEGGLIALLCFVAWLGFQLRAVRDPQLPETLRTAVRQVLWIFILGGLTQNAFYDADVRMGLIVLGVIVAIFAANSGTRGRALGVDDLATVVQ